MSPRFFMSSEPAHLADVELSDWTGFGKGGPGGRTLTNWTGGKKDSYNCIILKL